MVETTRVRHAGVSCSQDQESRRQPKGGLPSDVSLGLVTAGEVAEEGEGVEGSQMMGAVRTHSASNAGFQA